MVSVGLNMVVRVWGKEAGIWDLGGRKRSERRGWGAVRLKVHAWRMREKADGGRYAIGEMVGSRGLTLCRIWLH